MKRLFPCLLLGALAACQTSLPPDQAHFQKGYNAYEKGDYYTALLYLKPLVEEGSPAAELLMAKMYANGQGVKEDMGKAELLRNLAAAKIYSKPLPPGAIRPANATLKSVQDRLDYYADGANSSKAMSVGDISQVLTNLDIASIKRIAATDFENSSNPTQAASEAPAQTEPNPEPAQPEEQPPAVSAPPNAIPAAPEVAQAPVPEEPVDAGNARDANHMSLTLLEQSANRRDPLAMELLSSAYAKGSYGLRRDPKQAILWRIKARRALRTSSTAGNQDEPEDSIPVTQILIVAFAGLALMGGGAFLGWKRAKRRVR